MLPRPLSVFVCICLLHGVKATVFIQIPESILQLADVLAGTLDNIGQIQAGSTEHDYIQGRMIPVVLNIYPFLGFAALLFELCVNNRTVVLQVIRMEIDPHVHNGILLKPYNFTCASDYRPHEFQVEDLQYVHQHEFETDPNCFIRFVMLGPGSYTAIWPDCRSLVDGKHPSFTLSVTCTTQTSTVPLFARERAAPSPYVYHKLAHRFPLPFAPLNFVSFCDKLKKACALLSIGLIS